ncbi:MAG: methyltransferase domain-containing protein [Clostridiales bacterium]|nr:methyltransferase domain-containing protein [Clostridiales bacterium]
MEKKSAYSHLAKWFEYLNDDCDYENWSQYLILKLQPFPLRIGLDVGCGGGWFTRAFQRQGYQMTGLDISAEMLDFAQETAMKQGVRSEYLLGDIAKMKVPPRFDFATAINDCVNYIPKGKLSSAFKNIRGGLKKGGVFLFDISSQKKIEGKIANTVSVDDRDDVTYLSFNRPETDGVTMEVTLFAKRADGAFDRLDETHRQYIYKEEEILSALDACGFNVLEVEGHLGEDKTTADRITFLAQKR